MQDNAEQRAAYWPVAVARAVPLAGLGLWITFSADHSAVFGLLVFGVYGIVAGIVLGTIAWLRLGSSGVRTLFLVQAVVSVVAGLVALITDAAVAGSRAPHPGVSFFFLILVIFFAVTGALELYSGYRSRRRYVASTDWFAVGGLTAIAAIVFVAIPPGYSQSFTGPDHVLRVLDSAVVAVGLLGAYGAISAVYLLIAGLSAKWGTQSAATIVAEATPIEDEKHA
ncbi:hypothetical protein [Lacisediminihabitans changchengi]|uniref:Acyl-CoA synthetase n=1 Tax=Lacisediminihabitans changchengi TaxID=2787634 RepID=A0A934SLB6_9MICO|nr:hypothetical protein [Lacisediminihabitans changchengi]MBK4348726.1 hypothetical protein [Lacisediminihabitans changchengi]